MMMVYSQKAERYPTMFPPTRDGSSSRDRRNGGVFRHRQPRKQLFTGMYSLLIAPPVRGERAISMRLDGPNAETRKSISKIR